MEVWNNIALPDVPMPLTTPAATQPTPLQISVLVNNSNGNPVNDPDVVIPNLNTGEGLVVKIDAGSNYYQIMTGSLNVSAGTLRTIQHRACLR